MPAIKYIFLGIIQGLTEFLPVSSSAHLVIFQQLLELKENQILLDIVLHLGTLFALIVFLFKDIKLLFQKRILLYVILATVLTAAIALLGKDFFESMFFSVKKIALPLFITGVVLLCTKGFKRGERHFANLNMGDGFWLGIVQGLAVIPGLSRSGLTISTLLFRNVDKESAFKFSFLASVPAILGAVFLKSNEISRLGLVEFRDMTFGFFAAFFTGLLALKVLFTLVRKARLYLFGYYCLLLALWLWRR